MNWIKGLETFIAVVEAGSFNKASEKLFTTQSAVSKRIGWLESALSQKLLRRSTRQLQLTDEGKILYDRAQLILEQWRNLKSEMAQKDLEPQGILRIGIPRWLGYNLIIKQLPTFLMRHSKISISTKIAAQFATPNEENLDIIFAQDIYGKQYPHLEARHLISINKQVLASPSYLKNHPQIKKPSDCLQHNCLINNSLAHASLWELGKEKINVSGNYTTNEGETLIMLAKQGLGLVYSSELLAQEEIKRGELVPVLPNEASPPLHFYAYYSGSRYVSRATSEFLNYIISVIRNS